MENDDMDGYEWEEITYGRPTVPEFIEARAKGEMKMEGGKLYRKVLIPDDYEFQDGYWDYTEEDISIEKYGDKHGK